MNFHTEETRFKDAFSAVRDEINRAKELHPGDFKNTHEAYAVILEEVDELWGEIKRSGRINSNILFIRTEATQAAAMLIRLIAELT